MRKTFLIAAVIALIVAPFVSTASAQTLQTQEIGQKLDPIRVAPVLGWKNGKPIIGEWTPYKAQDGIGDPFPATVIFDSYEGDSHYGNPDVCDPDPATDFPCNGPLSGGVDPACDFGQGSTGACGDGDALRWFLGLGNVWAGAIGAIGSHADGAPTVSTAQSFAWLQAFGSDVAPPCETYVSSIIIINYYDNTVASLIDSTNVQDLERATTLADGFVDGIILDFGPIAAAGGSGFFANVDLTNEADTNLWLGRVDDVDVGLPSDGALEILFWDDDGLGGLIPGSWGAPFLWGTKDSSLQGSWTEGFCLFDGFVDETTGPTCSAYNGDYQPNVDDDVLVDPDDCLGFLMPMVGLFGAEGAPAIEICPDTATVTAGANSSGSSADICDEDSAIWTIQSETFDAAFAPPPVAITFDGTTNPLVGGTDVTLRLVGGPQFGNDAAFIQLRMFNFTTQAYVGMPFIAQPDSDNTVYESTRSAADFVGPNGELLAEITCAKTVAGPVRLRMDQVQWIIQ